MTNQRTEVYNKGNKTLKGKISDKTNDITMNTKQETFIQASWKGTFTASFY